MLKEDAYKLTDAHKPTYNQCGFSLEKLNDLSQAFVAFAKQTSKPVADIGCAFGFNTLQVLDSNKVMAIDIESQHLEALKERCTAEQRKKLTCLKGRFPEDILFEPESLSAVLFSLLLIFLKGKQIRQGMLQVYRWLEPGGKIFILTPSPYSGLYKSFADVYEKRITTEVEWPGEVEDLKPYAGEALQGHMPNFVHYLTPEVLCRELECAGFTVEESRYYSPTGKPDTVRTDKYECTLAVAAKSVKEKGRYGP